MSTVVASNGLSYHIWQLPLASSPELEDMHAINVIENEMTDGYFVGTLAGFTAGTRSWTLTFPTLASESVLPNTVTDVNGSLVGREEYVRSLFAYNKIADEPFVYLWSGVYYFVDFMDEEISLQRMRVKMYSCGLTIKQRRLAGVTLPAP